MGSTTRFEGEDVIITFEKEGADTVTNLECLITNLNISGGSGEIENIRTFGGCSIQVRKPADNFEVSFDYVTRDHSFAEVHFDTGATQGLPASGTEMRSGSMVNRLRWRVIIWFIGDDGGTAKSGTVVVPLKTGEILRYIIADCYGMTNDVTMASDGHLTGTITLQTSPTDASDYPNVIIEYTGAQATTALTVLNATAHRGTLTWNTTTPAWTGSYRT